jgi:integrase
LEIRRGKADPLPAITLENFASEHRQVMRGQVAWRTLQDQMRALNLFMTHVSRKMKLQNVSPRHAESFIAARLACDIEPATVNKDIRTLKRLFNLAIEPRGYLPEGGNPFKSIKPRKKTEKPKRYVSPEEYGALMGTTPDIWWRALMAVAYGAGLRRGEILNLTWSDVDFKGHQIHVRPKDQTDRLLAWEPKDHECRTIPVPNEVMRLLVDLQAESEEGCPYVFLPKPRWMHILRMRGKGKWAEDSALVNNVGRRFDQLRTTACIPECTLHDLRRSCLTNWARELPVHVVQKLAGHSDIKTTQKYYLIVQQADLDKARTVNSKILGRGLTDPLLTHSGEIRPSTKKAAECNSLAATDLEPIPVGPPRGR